MAPIHLDMSESSNRGLEEGFYPVRVEKIEEGQSKAGNQKLSVRFVVTDGPSAGRSQFDNFTLVKQALWKLNNFLTALGFDKDELASKDFILEPEDLVMRELVIEVRPQKRTMPDGSTQEQNQVKNYYLEDYEYPVEDGDDDGDAVALPPAEVVANVDFDDAIFN